jgi:hypothetical protein
VSPQTVYRHGAAAYRKSELRSEDQPEARRREQMLTSILSELMSLPDGELTGFI